MGRPADIPFVPWTERVSRRDPSCLFTGSATLPDVIAGRLIVAIAGHLPDVVFDLAGPVCGGLGAVPANVRLHARPEPGLFSAARLGLSPIAEVIGGNDRLVSFSRAGLPVIASPAASRGFEPELTDCWLVCSPEAVSLRDAIVESLDWDWSGPVAEAQRLVVDRYDRT